MEAYYVYMLRCRGGSLYTGMTNDVARRMAMHCSGRGAKYTRGRGPVELIYREACPDRAAALRREAAIKRLSRTGKQASVWNLTKPRGTTTKRRLIILQNQQANT